MSKNSQISPSVMTVWIFAGILGAIATGCVSFGSAAIKPEDSSNNNLSPTLQKTSSVINQTENPPIIKTKTSIKSDKKTNPQEENSSQKTPFIGTRFFNFYGGNGTGQSITILSDGTTTVKLHGTFESSVLYQGKFTNPINLQDENRQILLLKDGKIFNINRNGDIAKNCKGDGKPCESDLFEATSPPAIKEGFYILGGTDQGLEVRGDKYRYYDEGGEKPWREIYELQSIKESLVFDGKLYWCIPPRSEVGVCTENGWKKYESSP
jgi:hypothetical protein